MVDKPKKKKGFLARAFGLKSKEEKLAEAAAQKAAAQQLVDEKMATRMAAINAAALKSAREQDEAISGVVADEAERAAIEAEEKRQAELQAAKDVARAKQLAEEKKSREAKALKEAEAARLAQEKADKEAARLAAEQAELAAKREAEETARLAEEARLKAEARKALERAQAQQSAQEAEILRLKQEQEALAREKAATQARLEAEAQAKAAEDRAQAARLAEGQRLEAERVKAEKRESDRLKREALEAERRAEEAVRKAEAEAAQKAREDEAAKARAQAAAQTAEAEPATLDKGGFFARITRGLSKSTNKMSDSMSTMFKKRKLDDEALEDLEDLLITSDLGVGVATQVTTRLAEDKFDKDVTDMEIKIALADVISDILTPLERPIVLTGAKPEIMLFVGVNGSGKTTTLGKLAKRYGDQGKKVMLAAGDTFRAAAVEQLTIWGERSGAPVISGKPNADAAGLVYDAIEKAKQQDIDILMIDTAGRLQNRTELMEELSKVVRVIKKQDPSAPHHCILVLDATVGQNALMQTEVFTQMAGVTGLVMTKLDGTAKGGVLVALSDKFKLPIHHIGIGERIEDLENFSAPVFAAALSGVADSVMEQG